MIIDTTYLLPLAKINIPTNLFNAILQKKVDISIYDLSTSLISIFELQAKAAKLGIPHKYVSKAIRFIMKYLNVIDFWDEVIINISFDLRKILPDYIDCVIVATAIKCGDVLLTEDSRIHKAKKHIHKSYGIKIMDYNQLLKERRQYWTKPNKEHEK